ncbi:MAG: NUDIX domain-containing protein [Chloroflexi bacterium]|nr:NUDIX domain-containing protein [Chloroflexota bacterium]
MPDLATLVAVIQNDKVLLTQREDFEVWCLPGGHVEEDESVAEAAIREVREETGLAVEINTLVGVYSRLGMHPSLHLVLFTASPISDQLRTQPGETISIDYFSLDQLPEPLFFFHRQRIEDAMNGVGGGVAWKQSITPTFKGIENRQELYDLRDKSGLSRLEFYNKAFKSINPEDQVLEVGARKT